MSFLTCQRTSVWRPQRDLQTHMPLMCSGALPWKSSRKSSQFSCQAHTSSESMSLAWGILVRGGGAFLTGSPDVSRHPWCLVGLSNSRAAAELPLPDLPAPDPPLFLPSSLPSLPSLQRFQIAQVARPNPSFLLVSGEASPTLILSKSCFFLLLVSSLNCLHSHH